MLENPIGHKEKNYATYLLQLGHNYLWLFVLHGQAKWRDAYPMSVFGKIFEKGQADCPVDASGNIGVISVDKDGIITFTNAGGRKILQDLRGKGLPRQLVGRSLPELLGRRLSDTLMGRALMTEQELSGQLLMFGQTRYMTTIQLHRDSQGEVAGCTLYTIAAEGAESHSGLWQRFAYDLATHLGYNSIDWILNISDQHAQLLTKCLTTTEPAVPITRYCPYKFQCAFHPEHGWAALDRRMYHRVPIEIPIHGHLVKLPSGQTTSEQVREKSSAVIPLTLVSAARSSNVP